MKDEGKTREQLLAELEEQRRRNDRLEQSLVQDSEEHAYTELALLETEKRFRNVVENLEEGIGIVDESERFVFANSSAERIFGVGAGELIGLPLADFVDDETASFFEIETERRKKGVTSRYDIQIVTKDGSRRDLSVTVSPHLDENGRFFGTLGTFSDITERKRAEQALRMSEQRLRLVAEATTDLVYEWDVRTDTLEWFGDLEGMLGYAPGEIERSIQGWVDLIHPDDVERLAGSVELHRTSVEEIAEVYRVRRRDGTWVWWSDRGLPIVEDGVPLRWIGACADITERKQAERELQQARDYLEAALAQSPSGVIIADAPDGTIRLANAAAFGVRGGSKELLTGIDVSKHSEKWQTYRLDGTPYPTEDLPLSRAVLKGETVTSEEVIIRDEAGNDHWVLANAAPIIDPEGNATAAIVIFTDVTERKRAETALLRTTEELEHVIGNSPAAILVLDAKGIVRRWNPAAEKIFLWPEEEVLGKPNPTVSEKDIGVFEEHMGYMSQGGVLTNVEIQPLRKDGTRVDASISAAPIFAPNGEMEGVIAVLTDVTERKRTEEELRRSEKRFRDLAEMLPTVVFEADLELNLTYANEKAFDLFKYARSDFDRGMNCLEMVAPEERERARQNTLKRLQGRLEGPVEYTSLTSTGERFPVLLHMTPVIDGSSVTGFRGVMVDITDRKKAEEDKARLEEQLRRAQKLETVGTLAGGIAHDFNNVLAPILGYTDMALQGLDSGDPLAKDLQHVLDAAHRAKDLVQQILLFSKQAEQERNPIRLQAVVEEAIRLLRPTIPTTIDIRWIIDEECEMVRADATQLHQVIVNLCTNAWHAMREDGGTLTIELKQTFVGNETTRLHHNLIKGQYACLSVIDTGPGMEERIVERVFEPFFTTKAVDEGTGLGLSVVHGIVQSHDGEILVDSEPGRGTAFHVYLPTIAGDMDVEIDESGEAVGGSECILVVDDEPAIAELVRTMLASQGYEVEAYHSSSEALDAFRVRPGEYDLLVSDLTMPNMTGLALAGSVQKERGDFPVIIMTGFGDSVTTDNWEQHGVRKVIKKPVLMKDLAAAVRSVLDG